MKTILCTSECLYELYDLVLLLRQREYEVVLAMSMSRAIEVARQPEIDAVVISAMRSGASQVPASLLKFSRPNIPIVLIAYVSNASDVPTGVDGLVAGPEYVPELLQAVFAEVAPLAALK